MVHHLIAVAFPELFHLFLAPANNGGSNEHARYQELPLFCSQWNNSGVGNGGISHVQERNPA